MRVEKDQVRTILIILAMSAVFMVVVWWPLHRQGAQLRGAIAELDGKIAQDRTATVGLTALGEQIVSMQHAVDGASKTVPRESELASLLRQWSTELEAQQVSDQDIQTQQVVAGADYNLIPIHLKFRGSFMSAFRFLRHVESMNRLIRISKLEVQGNPERSDEPLMIKIELTTFSMPG